MDLARRRTQFVIPDFTGSHECGTSLQRCIFFLEREREREGEREYELSFPMLPEIRPILKIYLQIPCPYGRLFSGLYLT